jgi:hypothetical protein
MHHFHHHLKCLDKETTQMILTHALCMCQHLSLCPDHADLEGQLVQRAQLALMAQQGYEVLRDYKGLVGYREPKGYKALKECRVPLALQVLILAQPVLQDQRDHRVQRAL